MGRAFLCRRPRRQATSSQIAASALVSIRDARLSAPGDVASITRAIARIRQDLDHKAFELDEFFLGHFFVQRLARGAGKARPMMRSRRPHGQRGRHRCRAAARHPRRPLSRSRPPRRLRGSAMNNEHVLFPSAHARLAASNAAGMSSAVRMSCTCNVTPSEGTNVSDATGRVGNLMKDAPHGDRRGTKADR
jgi:hypothetical protein